MGRWSVFGCALVGGISCASRAEVPSDGTAVAGDHGDAPEAGPTEYEKGSPSAAFPGVHVLAVAKVWLGSPGSVELGAKDPADPDGRPNAEYDNDDGVLEMFVSLRDGQPEAELALEVGLAQPESKAWLNVLVDSNGDGRWGGVGNDGEWVSQNVEVSLDGKKKGRVELPPFRFGRGAEVPTRAWMRVAITTELVPKQWDGGGQFGAGEIEDYLVEVPEVPLVAIDCANPSHPEGNWTFDGARQTNVRCRLAPLNAAAEAGVEFVVRREKGAVTHSRLCRGAKLDPDSTEKEVRGAPHASKGEQEIECLFVKEWGLPSDWTFEVPFGRTTSKVTAREVRVGLAGGSSATFRIEKGDCLKRCRSSRECFGDRTCSDDCCVPRWADECATYGTAECGRCCAISAGAKAAECVEEACVRSRD